MKLLSALGAFAGGFLFRRPRRRCSPRSSGASLVVIRRWPCWCSSHWPRRGGPVVIKILIAGLLLAVLARFCPLSALTLLALFMALP